MIYTKQMFGKELKKLILEKVDVISIGEWSYLVYFENLNKEVEPGLRKIMLDLNTMELGPEFAISYDMLNKIADDLIAGKDVDLNSDDYKEVDEK